MARGVLAGPMLPPTRRQADVLGFIYSTARDRGYQPSFVEIMEHLGTDSPSGLQGHFKYLARKGWVRVVKDRPRAAEILRRPDGTPFRGFSDLPPSPAPGPDTPPLTDIQTGLVRYLYETARDLGYQPSTRDMMARFGWSSPNGAHCHLRAMHRKGWIDLGGKRPRAIALLIRPDGDPFRGFAERED
jgi:SOS-response transcriptional repressor LexA